MDIFDNTYVLDKWFAYSNIKIAAKEVDERGEILPWAWERMKI